MLILIVGLLVLLCVSTVQVAWNYHRNISPLDLPRIMQKYVRANVVHDLKKYSAMLFESAVCLLIIIAYPFTYILSILGYYSYKAYSGVLTQLRKVLPYL